MHTNCLYFR